jgi:hypothetical protein
LQANPADWQRTLDALRDAASRLAAVTAVLFGVPWQKQIDGSSVTVFSSATVKMSLHTGLTAVQDTDDFFNDVSASEITGTGYTAGGFLFANKTSAYDTASDQIRLDNTRPELDDLDALRDGRDRLGRHGGREHDGPGVRERRLRRDGRDDRRHVPDHVDATGWSVFDVT